MTVRYFQGWRLHRFSLPPCQGLTTHRDHFSLACTPYLATSCVYSLPLGKALAPSLLETSSPFFPPALSHQQSLFCQCRHHLCMVAICPVLLLGYLCSGIAEVVKGAVYNSGSNVNMPDEPPSEAPGMSCVLEGSSLD